MYSKIVSSAIAAALFASANAHFFINTPSPIPASAIKDPLDASGSNFPCHGADITTGSTTSMAAGSSQPLNFELGGGANTAVHGGGSCQISLTYETDATKLKDPASWKVIQSFLGGCPTNAPGNLPTAVLCTGSNGPQCVNNLSFKIPAEVANGNAILAWTWFNNVGNREMYMNCAKVAITGGTNSMSSLPAMFVANLASVNQCTTTENFNTDFPSPGAYSTTDSTLNFPLKAPGGTCPAGSGSSSSGSTGAASSAAAVPVASSTANNGQYTQAATAAPAVSSASNSGGVFAPGAATSVAAASPTATVVATTFVTSAAPAVATSAASPAAAATLASSAGAIGKCTSGQVACTASGFYCISGTQFGMCAFGCAVPMAVADGTSCTNNAVVHAVNHPKRRRSIHNVHRRFASGSF